MIFWFEPLYGKTVFLVLNLQAYGAGTYTGALPTSAQEMKFSISTLEKYLIPMNFELITDSINIHEGLALPGLSRVVYVRTPHFIVKNILFLAIDKTTGKKMRGSIYLVVTSKDAVEKLGVGNFNSTSLLLETASSLVKKDQFVLLLSKEISQNYYGIELSPLDFHMYELR